MTVMSLILSAVGVAQGAQRRAEAVSIVVRMAPDQPRTLADQLRSWSDAELAALLTERPDLATPAPQDTSQLASRAGTRASVLRALDSLTRLELAVLAAVVALSGRPPV